MNTRSSKPSEQELAAVQLGRVNGRNGGGALGELFLMGKLTSLKSRWVFGR
jgi:hypothetical protein